MSTYRLFIAIELPDALKHRLTELRANLPGATWVRPEAYHLTLRFVGDGIAESGRDALLDALGGIRAAPFDLALEGVGRFPADTRKPARVLWAGLAPQPALLRLHTDITAAVDRAGFPPDTSDFHAHITLARLKSAPPPAAVTRFLDAHRSFRADPFPVSHFYLIASTLTPQGPRYSHLGSYPLIT